MTAREWLAENQYTDILAMIDAIVLEWRASGKRTRRNWWGILAGGKNGSPRTVGGKTFPVLASAQRHEGLPVTPNAVQRSADEVVPKKVFLGKWWKKPKRR